MSEKLTCSCTLAPDGGGNMYYRGRWEYCPEYQDGDVVLNNGILYLCLKANAGKDPAGKDGSTYWVSFGHQPKETTTGRIVLDGGFATTVSEDTFASTSLATAIDGGSASELATVPLI